MRKTNVFVTDPKLRKLVAGPGLQKDGCTNLDFPPSHAAMTALHAT